MLKIRRNFAEKYFLKRRKILENVLWLFFQTFFKNLFANFNVILSHISPQFRLK
jgi:hypothetical protein